MSALSGEKPLSDMVEVYSDGLTRSPWTHRVRRPQNHRPLLSSWPDERTDGATQPPIWLMERDGRMNWT